VFGYSKINDIFFHRRRAVRQMNKLVTMVHILVGKPKMKYDPILLSDRAYVKLLRSSSTNRLNKKNRLEYSKESNKQIGERHWIFFGRDRIIGYMPRPILNRAIRIRRAKRNISNWRIQTQHVPYERVRAEEIARVKHMHYWQYAKNMRFRTRTEFRGNRTRVPPGELGLGFLALFENTVLPLIEYMPPVLITVFLMLLFYKLCYIVVYLSILIKGYAFNLFVDNTKDIATPINFGFTSRNLQHAMLQNAHNTLFLRTTPNFQPYLFQSRHVALMHNSQAFYPTPHWFVFTFPLKYVNFNYMQQIKILFDDIKDLSFQLGAAFPENSFNCLSLETLTFTLPEWNYFFYTQDGPYFNFSSLVRLDAYDYWKRKLFKLEYSSLSQQLHFYLEYPLINLNTINLLRHKQLLNKNLYLSCLAKLSNNFKSAAVKEKFLLLSTPTITQENLAYILNNEVSQQIHFIKTLQSHLPKHLHDFFAQFLAENIDNSANPLTLKSNLLSQGLDMREKILMHQTNYNSFFLRNFLLYKLLYTRPRTGEVNEALLDGLLSKFNSILNISLEYDVNKYSLTTQPYDLYKQNFAFIDEITELWYSAQNFEKTEIFFDNVSQMLVQFNTKTKKCSRGISSVST